MDIFLSRKNFFYIWNRSGTLDYIRNAVEIIAVFSSVQKLFKKTVLVDNFLGQFRRRAENYGNETLLQRMRFRTF